MAAGDEVRRREASATARRPARRAHSPPPAREAWIRSVAALVRERSSEDGAEAVVGRALASVHVAVCSAMGVPTGDVVGELAPGATPACTSELVPPAEHADARLLGEVHEALIGHEGRRARGAFYTPAGAAERVVGWALDAAAGGRRAAGARGGMTVCDPTVGGGSFLLAAADALVGRGARPVDVVRRRIFGADVDPMAVSVARAALTAWLGTGEAPPAGALVVADVLGSTTATWAGAPPGGFDVVLGNPPFLGQLARSTARSEPAAAGVRARFGADIGPYTDTAAVVLLVALDLARPGGAVALIQPESLLGTRDAAPVRRAVGRAGALHTVWFAGAGVFDAGVRVCVPVVVKAGVPSAVRLRSGEHARPVAEVTVADATTADDWSGLAAAVASVPDPPIATAGTLGDVCRATAGFRDEYYGLVPFVEDGDPVRAPGAAALVTSGLDDPARCAWGGRPARFARRSWHAPRVQLAALEAAPRLARWVHAQRVPKLLVATQTPVVEAVVDQDGELIGSTPVISVTCPADRLWHAAAALLSPVVSAWARRHTAGTALSGDAIKLSARQVQAVPVPVPGAAWDRAAAAVRAAHAAAVDGDPDAWRAALVEAAEWSCRAYGVDDGEGVLAWWVARLPAWR